MKIKFLNLKIFILLAVQANIFVASAGPLSDEISRDTDSKTLFATKRLTAFPATPARITEMADILNKDNGGKLNGQFYEDGLPKDAKWISHKQDLLSKHDIKYAFFYMSDSAFSEIVCIVGREPDFSTKTTQRFFYITNVKHQKIGITSEAIRGFLKSDSIDYKILELSIHPDNEPSVAIAQKVVGSSKIGEGENHAKTQPRHFYAISREELIKKISTFPDISYP
ncbi:MAG: hypothetical protein ACRCTK_05655 [Alphaproteobacteria bacterium]